MRTTITLDSDVAASLKKVMAERGISFKEAVNGALRTALAPRGKHGRFRTPTFSMGFEPTIPFDKALRLAAALEDEELARRVAARK